MTWQSQSLLVSSLLFLIASTTQGAVSNCGCKKGASVHDRPWRHVMGGFPVHPGKPWPWLVNLQLDDDPGRVYCGATMISKRTMVTAAHCVLNGNSRVYNREQIYAHLWAYNVSKEDDGTKVAVAKIVVHPKYGKDPEQRYSYDLALVQLMYAYRKVQPICLPGNRIVTNDFSHCAIVGYGLTKVHNMEGSEVPYEAFPPLVRAANCRKHWNKYFDIRAMLCAGRPGNQHRPAISTCPGDSGGPLMCFHKGEQRFHLVGVTSTGSYICGQRPSLYTDVQKLMPWIKKTVRKLGDRLLDSGKSALPKCPTDDTPPPPPPPPKCPRGTRWERKRHQFIIANQANPFYRKNVRTAQMCQRYCCNDDTCHSMLYFPDTNDCFLYSETRCKLHKNAVAVVTDNVIYFGEPC